MAMELNLETIGDWDLIELILRAKREGLSDLTEVERKVLFDYFNARRILIGNVFYQTQLGLLDQEFFDEVEQKSVERDGRVDSRAGDTYESSIVDSILAEMHRSAARG